MNSGAVVEALLVEKAVTAIEDGLTLTENEGGREKEKGFREEVWSKPSHNHLLSVCLLSALFSLS